MKPTERKKGLGGEGEGLVFGEPSLRYASSFDTFLKRFTSPRIRTALSWKNQFATISKGKGLGETMPRTRLPPRFFFLLFLIEGRGYFPYRISLQHPEFQARKTCTGNLKIISIGQQQRGDRLKRRIFPPSILFRIHPELFLFSFSFPFSPRENPLHRRTIFRARSIREIEAIEFRLAREPRRVVRISVFPSKRNPTLPQSSLFPILAPSPPYPYPYSR